MPQRTVEIIKKDFADIIKNLSYSKNKGTIFSDWLETAAIAVRQMPFNAGELPKDESYQEYEEKYLEVAGRYSREELNQFASLTALTVEGISVYKGDFLGEIYGSLELTNEDAGQFFTPFTVSTAMAKMMIGDVKQQVKEKGIITISDPASGAGGTLIAAAHEVAHQGIDPRNHVQFHATDISRNCFNMTYLQLSLMDLQAVVEHGNTISMEIWETRKTPQMMFFEDWLENNKTLKMVQHMHNFLTQLEKPPQQTQEKEAAIEEEDQATKPDISFAKKDDIIEQLSLFDSQEYES
ncbi:type I restriction-modification system methyltransferase subunit [Xenococcus sp. PCC 7305]|uniref:N-6 DNA methylase n=1 Tax=Xenococcus sp. PCC 7305 TaxID=102125 RepID=UPI0002AD160C|nr:N-6 DNA methylase [Xenococcus sp. PCC 7305]ELS02684.1 type I restriction-modification system methyltransferase subunit [Xenococcus sp. PCC 7305]